MVKGTHENIINAFFRLATKSPKNYNITITDIANEAHISRQAIYQKHYSTVEEIIDDIHERITTEIHEKLDKFSPGDGTPMLVVLSEVAIPIIYKHRVGLRILYTTVMDPHWLSFVEEHYRTWATPYIKKQSKASGISQVFLHKFISKQIGSLLSLWISEEVPDPPEVFAKTFLKLLNSSVADFLQNDE